MLYLIVDPNVLTLAPVEKLRREDLIRFINFMVQWEQAAQQYMVAFGITQNCLKVLKSVTPTLFDIEQLRRIVERMLPGLEYDDLLKVIGQFLDMLLQNNFLDDAQNELANGIVFEFGDIHMAPSEYINRLDELLRGEFLNMLGIVAFARRNRVMPLSDLQQIHVLTTLSDDERKNWGIDDKIAVAVNYDWVLDDAIEDWHALQEDSQVIDELPVISSPDSITTLARARNTLKTVEDAAQAAVAAYPHRLVLSRKAVDIARKSGYQNPQRIYEAITGLATYWLPVYEQTHNERKANDHYKQHIGLEISGGGQQVKQHPELRRQREVMYKQQTVFAELHIKLGVGKNHARIHFAPVREDNGTYTIVLAWVGKHADTARG